MEPDLDRLAGLEPALRARICGQTHVLPRVAAAFVRGEMGLTAPDRPRGSFLLCGPTGTGKTETLTRASEYVLGAGRLLTFDMSEYQDAAALSKLIGENRHDRGLLGLALAERGRVVLLFDEVDKAHALILDLFLQILWPGRITVATGETYSLQESYVAFTCNIGGPESMRMEQSKFSSVEQAVLRQVRATLRPELVGRIDEILVFARLSPSVQREIAALVVAAETGRLRGLGYDLQVSRSALEFLVREGFDPELGARPLKRTVERHLQEAIMRARLRKEPASGAVEWDSQRRCLEIAGHN